MVIEIRPGGYRGHAVSNHLVATGLSGALSQIGYVLRRVEMGQSFQRPAINPSLTPSPAVVESVDVPIDLRVEPYHSQSALNATVTLGGLKRYLADRFAFRRGPEFMVRAFIPNLDGNYVNPEDADEGPPSPGEPVDRRPRALVMRAILARRGGPAFRDAQLVRFGRRCAFSRCATVDVLEAAHIRPYRTGADNAADNGLLLRADLHTLYDLDLLAIDPDTSLVAVHVSIEEPTYQSLHGGGVIQPAGSVDMTALRQRWALFKAKVVP